MSNDHLNGKRVLITGSSRGIGLATARLFVASGAEVLLHGSGEASLAALRAEFGAMPALAADLADPAACRRLAEAAGTLDLLVNCAGIYDERSVEATDEAAWNRTLAINLTAPFLLSRALLPGLRERRGLVVNLASDSGLLGYPNAAAYCASKGGLIGLTRALAVELAPEVRALAICPGPVETDMMLRTLAATPDPAATRKLWEGYTLLRRVAQADEIAAAIAFAASPGASFATGAAWSFDGGATAGRLV